MQKICKIVTCGDVDSGKSTLLGRLLFNTGNIYDDQLEDIKRSSHKYSTRLEYGFIFDGLINERQQQITIDVAHRFFNIKDIRFHILDCPGHVQYTHNFTIGATEADIAVLVIDSTKGLMPQTFVHLNICKLFKVKKIIFVISKIDLVTENKLKELQKNIKENFNDLDFEIFMTSAIENTNMDMFTEALYNISEKINIDKSKFALCIQSVKMRDSIRYYQGISFGNFTQDVKVYPGDIECKINKVENQVDLYTLDRHIDISRGFLLTNVSMKKSSILKGDFIKFNQEFNPNDLLFKYGTGIYKVKSLKEKFIELNEKICFCNIDDLKSLGYGLLIDNKTKLNVGLFVISSNFEEAKNNNKVYWFTGYSGSGKTTLAKKLIDKFSIKPILLDGDDIRKTINYDLGLSANDRDTNVMKIANLAKLLNEQGFNVVIGFRDI